MFSSVLFTTLTALAAPPNILFITVDTLRADRLGCYGYDRPTSPHIDALAASSLVFDDMIVEEPQTGPSVIAMLTGLPPRVTGTVRNAVPVADGVPAIVEAFAAAGYATGAVVSNWNLKRDLSNIARGFDAYDDEFGKTFLGLARKERDAEDVTDAALAWFKTRDAARPFFYWAHYIDPHGPYHFRGRFNVHETLPREMDGDDALDARYDSEVAFADHHIGRLLEAVTRANTFVVLTGDHGESLMEHGYLGHTREIYQTTMRVPLTIAGPGVVPGRSKVPARGIDIGVTLLGLAHLAWPHETFGVDLINAPPAPDRVRVFETYDGAIPDGGDARAVLADRAPSRQGIIDGTWKLILRGGDELLFNLANDPDEETNVHDAHPAIVERLRATLEAWDAATPRNAAAGAALTEMDREALETLGYIE